MKNRELKKNIINMLSQYDFRSSVIVNLLREQIEHYENIYRKLNGKAITKEERNRFLSYAVTVVGTQADEVIDKLADEIMKAISAKYDKKIWKNLAITSALILPSIGSLIFYMTRHYFYVAGNTDAFQGIGYESFSATLVSTVLLIIMFVLSCFNEVKNN